MIGTAFGIVCLIVGTLIVSRLARSQRRLQERSVAAPDRSIFSTMELAPETPHHFQARTSKPADTFRALNNDIHTEKQATALAPTGIRAQMDYDQDSHGFLDDLERPPALPRLPLGEEEPDEPKQENLGF